MSSTPDSIKVSVIIPVYNSEALLPKCLDSLLQQTHTNLEIIIINDCSPNDTYHSIANYTHDKRIIYKKLNENFGGFGARVQGLGFASGDYVCFIDSDDYISPDYIRILLKTAVETQSDIVCAKMIMEDENSHYQYFFPYNEPSGNSLSGHALFKDYFSIRGYSFYYQSVWNKIYKKSVCDASIPYFAEVNRHFLMGDDIALSSVLLYHCTKYTSVDYYGYYYLKRKQSSTGNSIGYQRLHRNSEDIAYAFQFVENFLHKVNYYDLFSSEFEEFKELHFSIRLKSISDSKLGSGEKKKLINHLLSLSGKDMIRSMNRQDVYFYSDVRRYNGIIERHQSAIKNLNGSIIIDMRNFHNDYHWNYLYYKLLEIAVSTKKEVLLVIEQAPLPKLIEERMQRLGIQYQAVQLDDLHHKDFNHSFIVSESNDISIKRFSRQSKSSFLFLVKADNQSNLPSFLYNADVSCPDSNNYSSIVDMIRTQFIREPSYSFAMGNFYLNPYYVGYCGLGMNLLFHVRILQNKLEAQHINTVVISDHNTLLIHAIQTLLGEKIQVKAMDDPALQLWAMQKSVHTLWDVKRSGAVMNVEILTPQSLAAILLQPEDIPFAKQLLKNNDICFQSKFSGLSSFNTFMDLLLDNNFQICSQEENHCENEIYLALFKEDIYPLSDKFNSFKTLVVFSPDKNNACNNSVGISLYHHRAVSIIHSHINKDITCSAYYVLSRMQSGANQFISDIANNDLFDSEVNDSQLTSTYTEIFLRTDTQHLLKPISAIYCKEVLTDAEVSEENLKYKFLNGRLRATKLLFYALFDTETVKKKLKKYFWRKSNA